MVILWHKGISAPPTKVKNSFFKTGPSNGNFPIGFGRSRIQTGIPFSQQASMHHFTVQIYVYNRAPTS